MGVPKLMVIVNGSPNLSHSGEIYLQSLCSNYPVDKFCRFSLVRENPSAIPSQWLGAPSCATQIRREERFRSLGPKLGKMARVPVYFYIRKIHARKMIADAVRFGREQRIEQVWALLNSPQIIYIAGRIAVALRVPLVVTVLDPPERFSYDLGMDSFSQRVLIKDFAKNLCNAAKVAVISEPMRDEYHHCYSLDAIVQPQGLSQSLKQPVSEKINDDAKFTIGFAGFTYANKEFSTLLAALDSVGWKIAGKEVIVRILSSSMNINNTKKVNIEFLGWRPLEETIAILSKSDVNFIPYWFDQAYELAARLSFPSKFSAYLASGRPVFILAPEYASPNLFIKKYPVGLACQTLDSAEIICTLTRFIREPELYAKMARASQEAFDREFDFKIFLKRFYQLIGYKPNNV